MSPLCQKVRPFIEVIKCEPEDFISIIKAGLFYKSINIIVNMIFLHTYLLHYILSVLFGSLLSTFVHLLLQINLRKNMRAALFCVVSALRSL